MIYTILFKLTAINEKVAIGLVVDYGVDPWIKIGRVSDIIAVKMKVVAEKKPYLPLLPLQVSHLDLLNIYVQIKINRVMAAQFQTYGSVYQNNICNKAVIVIPQLLVPFRAHPGAVPINPYSEPERVSF